jgi:hypothetical protein
MLNLMRHDVAADVEVEAHEAESVDDVVLYRESGLVDFIQVKHGVDATTPVGFEWLTVRKKADSKSLLEKLYFSWQQLRPEHAEMAVRLVTDRAIDPRDPMMSLCDSVRHTIVPQVGGTGRALKASRNSWCEHLGVSEDELYRFLEDVRFETSKSMASEIERAELLLHLHGMKSDQGALDSGLQYVRDWVQDRARRRPIAKIRESLAERIGVRQEPSALFVIDGIDTVTGEPEPDARVSYVHLYDGDSAGARVQLADPNAWAESVQPQIVEAARRLEEQGVRRVTAVAMMRNPSWFMVGHSLPDTRGFVVATRQRDQIWSSDMPRNPEVSIEAQATPVGAGTAVAVAVSVAYGIDADVGAFVAKAGLPVDRVVSLTPSSGTGPIAVASSADANGLAVAIRDAVRGSLTATDTELYLFLGTPAGLALLIGHRWNRLRPTTVFEHLGAGLGYAPTFTVA